MASSTWIGGTGTWQSSGTNWSPPVVPNALTDVTLDELGSQSARVCRYGLDGKPRARR